VRWAAARAVVDPHGSSWAAMARDSCRGSSARGGSTRRGVCCDCVGYGEAGRWAAVLGLAMTREAEELLEAATNLPAAERAALVVRLLDSIAAPEDDVAEAQRSESRARLDAARGGEIDLLDDDDAMRMIAG